jgi:transposase-like protein
MPAVEVITSVERRRRWSRDEKLRIVAESSRRGRTASQVARERIAVTGQRAHPQVKRLGNPNGARALRGKQVGNKQAVAAVRAQAQEHAENLRAIIANMRSGGITSVRAMAEGLNARANPYFAWRAVARYLRGPIDDPSCVTQAQV